MNLHAGADAGTSSSGISERIKYQLFPIKDNAKQYVLGNFRFNYLARLLALG